jgi:predicted phage terminase large subunit-like protein
VYAKLGAKPNRSLLQWKFENGNKITFAHLQHEKDVSQYDGSQIPLICFDQLEHFTWKQFMYLQSRNRSMCGIRPYIRATCNPDRDHWLRTFLSWWIDDETGLPIEERSGVVRYYTIIDNVVMWGDTKKELTKRFGDECMPKSFTFIASSIFDNQILLKTNPEYLASLQALSRMERERLLDGNWNAKPEAGMYFNHGMFADRIIDPKDVPTNGRVVRGWDLAASDSIKSAFTAGVKIRRVGRLYYIEDVVRIQGAPRAVDKLLLDTAKIDGKNVRIDIPQDPGQAGKSQKSYLAGLLAGWDVRFSPESGNKVDRAKGLSAQCEAGNVYLVRGSWNDAFLSEASDFPESIFKDQVDAASRAFSALNRGRIRQPSAAAPVLIDLDESGQA